MFCQCQDPKDSPNPILGVDQNIVPDRADKAERAIWEQKKTFKPLQSSWDRPQFANGGKEEGSPKIETSIQSEPKKKIRKYDYFIELLIIWLFEIPT